MKTSQRFEEKCELFLAGNVEMYGSSLVQECYPQGEYLQFLGGGGEKFVILFKDTLLGQQRVLNIRLPNLSLVAEKRFNRSLRIMTRITDAELSNGRVPPFPRVYYASEYPSFYVSEYIRGASLREYMEKQGESLGIFEKLTLFKRISEGVHLLHQYGTVHRDLKPDNVMVNLSGYPKLIDFGIAMSTYENNLTRTDAQLGTPGYAAPEQEMDAGNVDHRADIYALGKVLYFIMVGDEDFNPERLPLELIMVVPRACQSDPERRYKSALDLLENLQNVYSEVQFMDRGHVEAGDLTVAQAFHDILGLFGGNTGEVKKILNLNMPEWDELIRMSKVHILTQRS